MHPPPLLTSDGLICWILDQALVCLCEGAYRVLADANITDN